MAKTTDESDDAGSRLWDKMLGEAPAIPKRKIQKQPGDKTHEEEAPALDITDEAAYALQRQVVQEEADKIQRRTPKDEKIDILLMKADALGDIASREFAPMRWVVEKLLPQGSFVLFSGMTKIGKSWLALQLASAVSLGLPFLGNQDYPCTQGGVLLLSLQLSPRQLHNRMESAGILSDNRVRVLNTFPTGADALDTVRRWRDRNDCSLIIIDMMEQVRDRDADSENSYAMNVKEISKWSRLSTELDISIVGLTHDRKMASPDFVSNIIGSTGDPGSSGGVWSLKRSRGKADAILFATGWDIEEAELPLLFGEHGGWELLEGTVEERKQSEARKEILEVLTTTNNALTSGEIAEMLHKKNGVVRYLLCMLKRAGEIESPHRGRYCISTTNKQTN